MNRSAFKYRDGDSKISNERSLFKLTKELSVTLHNVRFSKLCEINCL